MEAEHRAEFRFYQALNDFLPPTRRQTTLSLRFRGRPGIKDPIEALGVPHTEVELIVVAGRPVGFDYRLQPGDRVAVYPAFTRIDLGPVPKLREPLAEPRFVLDVNLGKLAKRLRLLGFDSLYRNDYHDAQVADIAAEERRIVLTRDRRLLHAKRIEHGYWVRAVEPARQVDEVLQRYRLHGAVRPFARCLLCNGELAPVAKQEVLDQLLPKTRLYYDEFRRCRDCARLYWAGSHVDDMRRRQTDVLG
jgi:uncharacterized protein with PIN domain